MVGLYSEYADKVKGCSTYTYATKDGPKLVTAVCKSTETDKYRWNDTIMVGVVQECLEEHHKSAPFKY